MRVQTQKIQELVSGLRIMVVDDVTDCRELVELYLMQIDARVQAVSSAKDALNMFEDFQPELIITDICMPEEDGYWLIEQLNRLNRESKTKIPAIALTSSAKQEDREQLTAAGYDGYLAKPFILEDLTKLIVQLTDR